MPLVAGRYAQTNPFWNIFGRPVNATQSDIAVRTNALVLGAGTGWTDAAYGAGTGTSTSVPLPVEVGDTFTTISFLVGATAEATGTHAFAALYSGIATTPALIVQSADVTGAGAMAASARYDFTIAATLITKALAPNGFIYATLCVTATTQPTLACATVAAGVAYAPFTTAPLFGAAAMTHGSAQGATAAATIASATVHAATPIVFLS